MSSTTEAQPKQIAAVEITEISPAGHPQTTIPSVSTVANPEPTHNTESSTLLDPETQDHPKKPTRRLSKLYMLKLSQHTLTSVVSIAVATLQLIIYTSYQHGKTIPNAWPSQPSLTPTLLLLGVAIGALAFDLCAILAYLLPGKTSSQRIDQVSKGVATLMTGLKGLGFAVAVTSSKTALDAGTNNDLWGWSCSDQAATMQSVNNAGTNCTVTTIAWDLAVAQIVLEGLNMAIVWLVARQSEKAAEAVAVKCPSCGRPMPPPSDDASESADKYGEKCDGFNNQLVDKGAAFKDMYKPQIESTFESQLGRF